MSEQPDPPEAPLELKQNEGTGVLYLNRRATPEEMLQLNTVLGLYFAKLHPDAGMGVMDA